MFDNDAYVHVPICQSAIESEDAFNNFKTDRSFTTILEHTADSFSRMFLNRIISDYNNEFNLIDWNKVSENDSIGGPELLEYPQIPGQIKFFSPSTIAYVFKALDILQHIKNSNLNDIDILEIGAGYGGQCKMIIDFAPLFDINIKSYLMIDLYWPNKLQEKYLNHLGYSDKLKFISYEDLYENKVDFPHYDYLISIYALSEFSSITQNFYLDKLNNPKNYYLVWNSPSISDIFLLADIEEESPRTGPFNTLIRSKVRA